LFEVITLFVARYRVEKKLNIAVAGILIDIKIHCCQFLFAFSNYREIPI